MNARELRNELATIMGGAGYLTEQRPLSVCAFAMRLIDWVEENGSMDEAPAVKENQCLAEENLSLVEENRRLVKENEKCLRDRDQIRENLVQIRRLVHGVEGGEGAPIPIQSIVLQDIEAARSIMGAFPGQTMADALTRKLSEAAFHATAWKDAERVMVGETATLQNDVARARVLMEAQPEESLSDAAHRRNVEWSLAYSTKRELTQLTYAVMETKRGDPLPTTSDAVNRAHELVAASKQITAERAALGRDFFSANAVSSDLEAAIHDARVTLGADEEELLQEVAERVAKERDNQKRLLKHTEGLLDEAAEVLGTMNDETVPESACRVVDERDTVLSELTEARTHLFSLRQELRV